MEHLPRVIGPAPSELPFKDFIAKLVIERQRVKDSLASFKAKGFKTKKKPTKKQKGIKISALSKELSINPTEMLKILEEIENEHSKK